MKTALEGSTPSLRTHTISGQQKSVLIVDDDPLVSQSIQHLLKRMDLASHTAGQWAEAIDALERERPDLMLLDMRMPNVDGPTLLEFVRESGYEMPVVVVSASLNEVDLNRLRELGVKRFVPKPFSVEQLRGIIEEQLSLNASPSDHTGDGDFPPKENQHQAIAVSTSHSVLGRRWRPRAGERRKRQRQFWTIAVVCVALSVLALGAKWAVTFFMPSINAAIEQQSDLKPQ